MKFSLAVFVALFAVASAVERVSVAGPEVGGAAHRDGGMNARGRRRRAAEQRKLRMEKLQN